MQLLILYHAILNFRAKLLSLRLWSAILNKNRDFFFCYMFSFLSFPSISIDLFLMKTLRFKQLWLKMITAMKTKIKRRQRISQREEETVGRMMSLG